MMDHIKDTLCSEWEVTNLGEPSKIIGIEITHTADAISTSQQKCIKSVLQKEGMENVNPVGMPMDLNVKISPNPEVNEPNHSNAYMKLLSELQFIANST